MSICQIIGLVGALSNPVIVATTKEKKTPHFFQLSQAPSWCQIEKIKDNYAIVLHDSRKHLVRIGPSDVEPIVITPEIEYVGNKISLTRAYLDYTLENLPSVLMQMATVPYMPNGSLLGFTLDQIDEDSIFYYAGMRNGDIVIEINDAPLTDAAATVKLLGSLKEVETASFTLLREGEALHRVIQVK